jgi:hypothetical protein
MFLCPCIKIENIAFSFCKYLLVWLPKNEANHAAYIISDIFSYGMLAGMADWELILKKGILRLSFSISWMVV